ncbi:MAG: helix-turn-helix transcriptional regulator [Metallibacterium scheffleri]
MENSNLLDERELAARLHVSVSTLRNWRVARRGPPFVKLGLRAVRYRLADVERFIEAGVCEQGRAA